MLYRKGTKKVVKQPLVTKTQLAVLFSTPLVVHSFLWLRCFHFVWLFLFVISNWHWQWLPCVWREGVRVSVCVGCVRVCMGVGCSSVWPLWPPCQFSGQCLPSWYFSAWEQSTNTNCYNSPSLACLSHFVLWFHRKGPRTNTTTTSTMRGYISCIWATF